MELQQQIHHILLAQIPKHCELPDQCLLHMAGIIVEEPPQNQQDMFDLLGEFIANGSKLTRNDVWALCGELNTLLWSKNLIKKENKLQLVAEQLPTPVVLKDLEFSVINENTSGYEDMFKTDKKAAGQNDEFVGFKDPKKMRQREREEKKAEEDKKKHLEAIKLQKVKIPPAKYTFLFRNILLRVRHDKSDQEGKPLDINLDKISVIIGGRALLEDTSLKLPYGRKYGLIGRNGIGKTCLMNQLANYDFEKLPKYIHILLVEQEIEGSDKTPLELVVETDGERSDLMKSMQQLSDSDDKNAGTKIAAIQLRLEQIEAQYAEAKANEILAGLGFTQELIHRKTKHLSGGWRMRVSLARALYVKPDVLLLDEPTNHLDLDAVMWLEDYIINCKHTVVVVSHAREFLNNVCNEIIHFHDQKLTSYKGNYDQFEKTRKEKLSNQFKQHEAQQMKVAHMQDFIDKFRYNAKRASLVQSRIKALQKMDLIDEVVEDPSCVFIFPNPEKLRPPLLKIEEGQGIQLIYYLQRMFGYNIEKVILKNINYWIEMESRMAIVGANGVGKSTFLNLLVENLKLIEGNYYRNPRLRVSLFTQHHIDQLDLMLSPIEQLQKTFPGQSVESYRGHLSSFGLAGNLQLRPQYLLSGGQKSRVSFAMAVWNNPQILIMDEPTNHLDIDAVNALIVALNNFQGGLIIVSHDQYFVSTICDEIWYIKDQRLKKFSGDFDDYKKALSSHKLE